MDRKWFKPSDAIVYKWLETGANEGPFSLVDIPSLHDSDVVLSFENVATRLTL